MVGSLLHRAKLAVGSIQGRANLIALSFVLALGAQYAVFSYSVGKSGVLVRDMAHDRESTETLDTLSDSVREFGFRLIGTNGGIYAAPSSAQRVIVLAERIEAAWQRARQTLPIRPDPKILANAEAAIASLPAFARAARAALAAANPRLSEAERRHLERLHDDWLDISVPLRRYVDAVRGHVAARAQLGLKEIEATERLLAWISGGALLAGMLAAMLTWSLLAVWIARPTSRLATITGRLATGNLDAEVPYTQRADEVGRIARALAVFRQNAIDKLRLEQEASLSREREFRAMMLQEELEFEANRSHELAAARDAALAANRTKSEFLANMSHELRTPLNAIIGFSEMMGRELLGPLGNRKYAGYVNDIHLSGHHLLAIINDILDLSKIEAGKLQLDEGKISIARALSDCERIIGERAKDAGIALEIVPAIDVDIVVDPTKYKQVLLNLLSNAVKFTPAGGRVTVEVTVAKGVAVAISDTGIGMHPEEIPIALAPFRQVHGAINRKYEGTGLGLPLAKALVELHGGVLGIESRFGQGSTVTVSLPAERMVGAPRGTGELVALDG